MFVSKRHEPRKMMLNGAVIDELHIEADGRRTVALAAVGPRRTERHKGCDLLSRITDDRIDMDGCFLVVLLQEQSFPRDGELILVFLNEHSVPEAAELEENELHRLKTEGRNSRCCFFLRFKAVAVAVIEFDGIRVIHQEIIAESLFYRE